MKNRSQKAWLAGAASALALLLSAPPAAAAEQFGVVGFDGSAVNAADEPETRAAAHPDELATNIALALEPPGYFGAIHPVEDPETFRVEVPAGLLGDPSAVPGACASAELFEGNVANSPGCLIETQVGYARIPTPARPQFEPLFKMAPSPGVPASFGLNVEKALIRLDAVLVPGDDYKVAIVSRGIPQGLSIHGTEVVMWGIPADPSHDDMRGECMEIDTGAPSATPDCPVDLPRLPFLSNPTRCTAPGEGLQYDLFAESWAGNTDTASFRTHLPPGYPLAPSEWGEEVGTVGCDQVPFGASIAVRPTTSLADSPSGLEFDLHIPQSEDPDGLATAHLKDAVVTLPEGMTVNPPSADGLGACSLEQLGMSQSGIPDGEPVSCPDNSKLGSVEAVTPLLEKPVKGSVYLAEQNRNPFNSLIAMYMVLEDKERGVLMKLPGKVEPDPATGRLTASFRDNPQFPVEDLRLRFFAGPRAALKTPSGCGSHSTTGTMAPWSAPEAPSVAVSSSFQLEKGPNGGACLPAGAAAPNAPAFDAGTLDPTAKAYSPFVMRLARADGSQPIRSIDAALPKGLLAKLAGTSYCPEAALAAAAAKSGKAEQGSPSCPASSHVGSVTVGAGAGSTPLHVRGEAYLAGPYKGAPLSLAIITPAVAGPFDLGTVVVRSALDVDPETAQARATSDQIPTILQGIPLEVRTIALKLDRPQFTLNPTSCDPSAVMAQALSVYGQAAALSAPFQVGGCAELPFRPKLSIRLKGDTKRTGHPALTATLIARPGDANIGAASVALPKSEFLAQSHIRTICTRVQFAADACPAGSIYGTATAITPLLDEALTGNVYLRSSSNKLPDMVIALKGKVDVDLVGRIDSDKQGGIRTTFDAAPDAPLTRFTLRMQGGRKSLLENSRNLCSTTNKATVRMVGQNGKAHESRPVVKSAGCGKARKGKKGKKRR